LKHAFAQVAYSTLLRLLTPLYLARLWWRGRREPAYRMHWGERLGLGDDVAAPGAVWVHAVSLGETRAAQALIDAMRAIEPDLRLLLTHGTATGREAGRALLRPGDGQVWLPYDTPGAVRRFLVRHRPAVGVLMETEIWPNLLRAAAGAGVPVVLANARLSEKSLSAGVRFGALIRPAVESLDAVLAQTDDDAARLREAGARAVTVVGNLKFDMTPPAHQVDIGAQWRRALARPVVLAASTREGEEDLLLRAWAGLPGPRPLLVIVPRHPQRFDDVEALVRAGGWRMSRRSDFVEAPPPEAGAADIWLGDSMGEMPTYYGAADVALLGGSFAPLGGQNLIEACACGCPLVMGPHTFNFALAAEMASAAGAARRVADIEEGVHAAVALALDGNRSQWVQRALEFARAHRGAAQRMATEVLSVRDARDRLQR
jgi:3-deoxy-D-manno-octulosonic-acid transferase